MNHLRYTPEAFKPDGTLISSPSADVISTLSKYGMLHPLTKKTAASAQQNHAENDVERLVREAQKAKSARLIERNVNFINSDEYKSFKKMYDTVLNDAGKLMANIGETPPKLEESAFLDALPSLIEDYYLFEGLGLEPQLVLAPTHRSWKWWRAFVGAARNNPLKLNLESSLEVHDRVGNTILHISAAVIKDWAVITNCNTEESGWSLSIMSAKNAPYFTDTTPFGYSNKANTEPHKELNELLQIIGKPTVKNRNHTDPLTQPDIHPTLETYIMYHLTHAFNGDRKIPTDTLSMSFLAGILTTNHGSIACYTDDSDNSIVITNILNYAISTNYGIRPTIKAAKLFEQ